MPSGILLTIINYSLYFTSVAIIGVPSFRVLSLPMKQIYAIIIAVIIWAIWVFGVKYLFVWLIRALGAGGEEEKFIFQLLL